MREPRHFIVAKRDEFGYPSFGRGGCHTYADASRMAQEDGDGFEVLTLAQYYEQADSDELPERRARRRAGLPAAPQRRAIVVTGSFVTPRAAIHEALKLHGWHVQTALSSLTTHVLAGDAPGSTVAKARERGLSIFHTFEEALA